MPFHFCPQCGTKLQPDFQFCPSCGEKLPGPVEPSPGPAGPAADPLTQAVPLHNTSVAASNTHWGSTESLVCVSPIVSPRPPLGKTRNSVRLHKRETSYTEDTALLQSASSVLLGGTRAKGNVVEPAISPQKAHTPTALKRINEMEDPLAKKPSAQGRGRPRQVKEEAHSRAEQGEKEPADPISPSPPPSPFSKGASASAVRGKSKKAKRVSAVSPLEEGEELTDTVGRKWRLGKQLSQTTTDLFYEVFASNSMDSNHIVKLGTKDGRIFNEQNFLQRAAKPLSVDKWIKRTKVDFLGIPSCVGFGLHADTHRFLILPSMGQTLLSILEDRGTLSEKVVLHIACRILDVLKFIHSSEYVHGDINAENVYIKSEGQPQVSLAGYSHAFRYCPGGQHVEYRQASRIPHEGAVEYISVDSHKGAGPSQRSDLQSLGYCMLHWHTGTLPWATLTDPQTVGREKQRFMEDVPALMSHCFGKNVVSGAMQQYLIRVMALGYADTPDYTTLKAGLHDALLQLGGTLDQPLSF